MINVTDNARIHLAALMDGSVKRERILMFDTPLSWSDIVDVIREIRPDTKLPEHLQDQSRDLGEPDNCLEHICCRSGGVRRDTRG